jgi:hypothetical protein
LPIDRPKRTFSVPLRLRTDAELIDREVIPLSLSMADEVIGRLQAAATEIREAVDEAW